MRKVKNCKILLILLILLSMFLCACTGKNLEDFYINRVEEVTLNVGEIYDFEGYYKSSNEEIFRIDDKEGVALAIGDVNITLPEKNTTVLKIHVVLEPKYINVECDYILKENETTNLNIVVSPISCSQQVDIEINDNSVIKIENNVLTALKEGYTTVVVRSKEKKEVYTEFDVLVQNEDEQKYDEKVQYEIENVDSKDIDATDIAVGMNTIINNVKNSVLGVEKYTQTIRGNLTLEDFGSGIIYKRDAILNDGTKVEDIKASDNLNEVKNYIYYVISTRTLIINAKKLKIYLGEEYNTYEAEIVQSDDKVDISLLKFECNYYLPLIKLADSDNIKQGEFVIDIGNSNGKDYFRTSTSGVISSVKRYLATDTDGDQTSDWDSEFIQHDASINSDNAKKVVYSSGDIYNYINGGALINLKGELIGMDSLKIANQTTKVQGMSLAIPSNLIQDIVNILITGKAPQRALLGVTIMNVNAYYQNKDYYLNQNPSYASIPDGLEYGFYIASIVDGGVAQKANAKVGDILIKFNGAETRYSYIVRAELGKFIIGSGDTAELVVLRNGEEVTLTVTF